MDELRLMATAGMNECVARLLVADDHELVRTTMRSLLERLGYPVDVAANGEEVIAATMEHYYDVVVLDYLMPGTDGMTVLRWLHPPERARAVVMVTGDRRVETGADALRFGATACLGKPVLPGQLAIAVSEALGVQIEGESKDPAVREIQRSFWRIAGAEDVAARVGLSPRAVGERVKRETGLTVPALIRNLRVESAERLLEETEYSVSRIAKAVGYEYPQELDRAFRKELNITPTAHRRRTREGRSPE